MTKKLIVFVATLAAFSMTANAGLKTQKVKSRNGTKRGAQQPAVRANSASQLYSRIKNVFSTARLSASSGPATALLLAPSFEGKLAQAEDIAVAEIDKRVIVMQRIADQKQEGYAQKLEAMASSVGMIAVSGDVRYSRHGSEIVIDARMTEAEKDALSGLIETNAKGTLMKAALGTGKDGDLSGLAELVETNIAFVEAEARYGDAAAAIQAANGRDMGAVAEACGN